MFLSFKLKINWELKKTHVDNYINPGQANAGRGEESERSRTGPYCPCYLSSSDGHLGLLIYRLVTETAYQQQPRPSAHAHRERLIWILEEKTYTHTHTRVRAHTHAKLLSNPGLSLLSIVWLWLLSPGVTASRWLPWSCQRRPRAPTHMQGHTLVQKESYCIQNICTVPR